MEMEVNMGVYAKAIVAFITTFLGFAAARGVELGFWVEGILLAVVAGLAVFAVPNQHRSG